MKFVFLILLIFCLQSQGRITAQTASLRFTSAPLQKIFSAITEQTGVLFLYTEDLMQQSKPVTIQVANASLDQVLRVCFNGQPLDYSLINQTVVVKQKVHPPVDTLRTITGVVTAGGLPLAGVSVVVKFSLSGTVTDAKGTYSIFIPSRQPILIFSCVGYTTQEVSAFSQMSIHVELLPTVSQLDETIFIGYGTTTKRLKTGNITTIQSTELRHQPISNPLAALQGRVAGLDIGQSTGLPGSHLTVRLRGQNSIASGNDPMFIIDGIPFLSITGPGSGSTSNTLMGGNPLNTINPLDIERIEILKDADATAIYGSRGANGVILITTKKGTQGKTNLEFQAYSGVGNANRKMNLLHSVDYLRMRHEAFANDAIEPSAIDYDVNGTWDTSRYTNWQNELIGGTSLITDAQGTLSGGDEYTNFHLSTGYRKESSAFPFTKGYERASLHLAVSHTSINKKLTVAITSGYYSDENQLPNNDPTYQSISLPPVAPPAFTTDGSLNWANSSWNNPYKNILDRYKVNNNNLLGSIALSYALSSSLSFKASAGYNHIQSKEISSFPLANINPVFLQFGSTSKAMFGNKTATNWIVEPQLLWKKNFSRHRFDAIIGSSYQFQQTEQLIQTGTQFLSDLMIENIKGASVVTVNSNRFINYRYLAFFGRLNYQFKNSYLLNVSARRDGSSRFGPDNQFANFAAVGAGWIFSNLSIIKKQMTFISFGKIRASYGSAGNEQIGDYQFLDQWSTNALPYHQTTALIPERLPNANYGWEVNKKFEAGLEMSLFDNGIDFQFNYYRNRTNNQLVGYPQPLVTGFPMIQYNLPAIVQNTGFEIELSSTIVSTKRFSWQSFLNISFPDNQLVSYPGIANSNYNNTYVVGKSLFTKQKYHAKGLHPTTGAYIFLDVNDDGSITYPQDLTSFKEVAKEFYGGFRNTFSLSSFRIDFLFYFVKQTGNTYFGSLAAPGFASNQPSFILNNWKKPGDQGDVQPFTQNYGSPYYAAFSNASFFGDNKIGDASYIRLKNVSVTYSFPTSLIQQLPFDQINVFLQGQNLFTITPYKGLDPETQSLGNLPPLRIMTAGLQFKL